MKIIKKGKDRSDKILFEGDPEECRRWVEFNTPVRVSFATEKMCEELVTSTHPQWPLEGWSKKATWLLSWPDEDKRLTEKGGFRDAEDALSRGLSKIADGRIYAL